MTRWLMGWLLGMTALAVAHGPWTEKIQGITRALRSAPDSTELWLTRADYFRQDGNLRLAADDLARAARLDPEHSLLFVARAQLAIDRGDFPSARQQLEAACARGRDDRYVLSLLGRSCLEVADTLAAINAFAAIPRPGPDQVELLAHLYEASGQPEQAVALLRSHFEPDRPVLLRLALAGSLARNAQLEEAQALLHEARDASRIQVFWKLAEVRVLHLAGKPRQARAVAASALVEIETHLSSGRMRPSAYLRSMQAEALALGGAHAKALGVLGPGEDVLRRVGWLRLLGAVEPASRLQGLLEQRDRGMQVFEARARTLHEMRMRALIISEDAP